MSSWLLASVLALASCGVHAQDEQPSTTPDVTPAIPMYILHWPFHPDQEGVEIYQTYGQAEGQDSINIHLGLDIHAPAGTPIYASISGTVAAMFEEGMKAWTKGFAIRSLQGEDEFITQFLHLEPSSIQFALGDEVRQGDLIGELAEWPEDEGYLPHLHIGVGDGRLFAATNGPDRGNAALIFTYNANPLRYLQRKRDEVPPSLVRAESGDPFVFRAVEQDSAGHWKRSDELADPQELTGLYDIEVSVRDSVQPGTRFAVAPRAVRFEITCLDEPTLDSACHTVFDGVVSSANVFPYSAYVEVPKGPGPDARFVYHYMAMRELDARPSGDLIPRALDTHALGPGRYRVAVHASDLESDVFLGEMTVRFVGAQSR